MLKSGIKHLFGTKMFSMAIEKKGEKEPSLTGEA